MRELFFFATTASLSLTVFIVAVIELYFTRHRRKLQENLDQKVKELKVSYNTQLNQLVLEDEKKLEEAEEKVGDLTELEKNEKKKLEKEYKEKLEKITAQSEKALTQAKEKAKELEKEAENRAETYLKNRQKEVEEDLMNLVMSVTKKVLPQGITYQIHKELVLSALQDVKKEEITT